MTASIVKMQSYCDLEDRNGCTRSGELWDLMQRNINFSARASNDYNHFPIIHNASALTSEFLELAPNIPELRAADVLICFEPAFLCGPLLRLGGRPVIGYIGNPLGTYLHEEEQEEYYEMVRDAMQPKCEQDAEATSNLYHCMPDLVLLQVRHSRMRYLNAARYGIRLRPNGKFVGASSSSCSGRSGALRAAASGRRMVRTFPG